MKDAIPRPSLNVGVLGFSGSINSDIDSVVILRNCPHSQI